MDGNGRWARAPRAAGRRRPPRGHARAAAHRRGGDRPRRQARSPSTRSRPRTGRARADEVDGADGDLRRDDRARAARPRRAGRPDALHRPPRPRARGAARADGGARGRDGRERRGSRSGSRSTTAAGPSSWRRRGGSSKRASPPTTSTRTRSRRTLYAPELPDPDLLIRTSGELRLSNFLLWQLAYAELVFVDTLWPDFGEAELRERARRVRAAGAGGSAADERAVRLAAARRASSALPVVLGLV